MQADLGTFKFDSALDWPRLQSDGKLLRPVDVCEPLRFPAVAIPQCSDDGLLHRNNSGLSRRICGAEARTAVRPPDVWDTQWSGVSAVFSTACLGRTQRKTASICSRIPSAIADVQHSLVAYTAPD